jgi:hypothetical protein
VTVPAAGTEHGIGLFILLSFQGLAPWGVEGPGCYSDEETLFFVAPADQRRLLDALYAQGYVPLLEDVLFEMDDEPAEAGSWYDRFFDFF